MTFHVEAIIENGMIKPLTAIPFAEQTRVQVVIQPELVQPEDARARFMETAGMIPAITDPAVMKYLMSDENSILESP
jgi:predicted DNA-binding antitoxin AbrB/MazE fold protein